MVIVPPEHPLASRSEIHLEETLEYKQIILRVEAVFDTSSIIYSIRSVLIRMFPMRLRKITWLPVLSPTVSGIAVAPDIPIIHSLNLKVLPLVSPTWQRNFYMATLKDAYHPPVVDIFKQFVIDQTRGELDYRTI